MPSQQLLVLRVACDVAPSGFAPSWRGVMSQYVARCVLRNESWIARVVGDVGGRACARGPIPLSGDLKTFCRAKKEKVQFVPHNEVLVYPEQR